jgi:Tol biopolymer transport system component
VFYHTPGIPGQAEDYSLLLMQLKENQKESVEEIAPPSRLGGSDSPTIRETPEWSPSGNYIYFEGEYAGSTDSQNVVSLKDHKWTLYEKAAAGRQGDPDYAWLKAGQFNPDAFIKSTFDKDYHLPKDWKLCYADSSNQIFAISSSENQDLRLWNASTKQMTKLNCKFDLVTDSIYWIGSREP